MPKRNKPCRAQLVLDSHRKESTGRMPLKHTFIYAGRLTWGSRQWGHNLSIAVTVKYYKTSKFAVGFYSSFEIAKKL